MSRCQICEKREHERNMQEQCGFNICISCDGLYTDDEILEMDLDKKNAKYSSYGAKNLKTRQKKDQIKRS